MSFKRSAECAWKTSCSLQWWDLWGRGWQSSKNGVPDWFFLSHLQKLNVWEKNQQEWVGEGEVQVPKLPYQQQPSSMLPAERCRFHKWCFSKHSISQLPALCSSSAVPFKICPYTSRSTCALLHWSLGCYEPLDREAVQFHLHCYFPHLENSAVSLHWCHLS